MTCIRLEPSFFRGCAISEELDLVAASSSSSNSGSTERSWWRREKTQRSVSVVRHGVVTTHHDRLFRYVFSDPEQAAGEIRVLLPEEVSRRVNWRTLRPLSGTFVDEVLDERRSDVLFRVDLGGREALLYLLLEHQSTSDPLMPFRLLRYMVRIWDGYLAEHPKAKVLPAIVLMVVHHSEGGWRVPTEFTQIMDLGEPALGVLRRHLPSFELLLDDLSATRDEDLHGRVLVPALGRLSLLCLKWSSQSPDVLSELRRSAELVQKVAAAPSGVAALSAVVSYLLEVGRTSLEDLGTYFRALGPRTETAFMTGADILRAEGEARGEARGRAEGEARGEARAVLRVLERRRVELSEDQRARIEGCRDLEQLEQWLDRALVATSGEELFG